jgi:hypothetical protein
MSAPFVYLSKFQKLSKSTLRNRTQRLAEQLHGKHDGRRAEPSAKRHCASGDLRWTVFGGQAKMGAGIRAVKPVSSSAYP